MEIQSEEYTVIGRNTVIPSNICYILKEKFDVDTKINICICFDQLLISKQDSEKISEVQKYMEKNVKYYTILN